MSKSPAEYVLDLLLEFLPGQLPSPLNSIAKVAVNSIKDRLDKVVSRPRIKNELLNAAREAEQQFLTEARKRFEDDELIQAIVSLPLWGRELFQTALQTLPYHLNEDILAQDLEVLISDDWHGKFSRDRLLEAIALYINCLRTQLLKVDEYAELITQLAVLRSDVRLGRIDQIVGRIENKLDYVIDVSTQPKAYLSGLRTAPTVPKALPESYVLRSSLIEQIKNALGMNTKNGTSDTSAIVALLGIGGVGKTVLANAIANDPQVRITFPGGILWATLGPDARNVTIADTHLSDWLMAMQVDPSQYPDAISKAEAIRHLLAQQKRILIVDDIWYEEAVAPFLIARSSQCTLLLTSRDRELVTRLGVNEDYRIDINALTEEEARNLVEKIIGRVSDDTWSYAVRPVMIKLGWHALATQLVSKQVSLGENWEDILNAFIKNQALEYIDFIDPQTPAESLHFTFKLSTDVLDDLTKECFAWLGSLAPGEPFLAEDAMLIWHGVSIYHEGDVEKEYELDLQDARKTLRYLTRRGLLEIVRTEHNSSYHMHVLLWEYANKLLRDLNAQDAALIYHARVYVSIVSRDNHLGSTWHETDIARPQWRNVLERAWLSSRKGPGLTYSDTKLANNIIDDMVSYLTEYWSRRGLTSEAMLWQERAVQICESAHDRQAESVHLGNLGATYLNLGRVREAVETCSRALIATREAGDRRGEGTALNNLGLAYASLGNLNKSIELYQQAIAIAREVNDRRGEGNALSNLGVVYRIQGKNQNAIDLYNEALKIARETSDRANESSSLSNLGIIYERQGNVNQAIKYFQQALKIAEEIGFRIAEAALLSNLGVALSSLNRLTEAIEYFEKALKINQETGNLHGAIYQFGNLGNLSLHLGDVKKAVAFYEKASLLARENGDLSSEATALGSLGMAYGRLGDTKSAIIFLEDAIRISHEIGDLSSEGTTLGNLAIAYMDIGNHNKSFELFERSLSIARETGERPREAAALDNLANAYARLGDKEKAIHFAEQALAIFVEIDSPHLQSARQKVSRLKNKELAYNVNLGMPLRQFIIEVIRASRQKGTDAEKYFNLMSEMVRTPGIADEMQVLARILQQIIAGKTDPDLSALPDELVNLVQEGLSQ